MRHRKSIGISLDKLERKSVTTDFGGAIIIRALTRIKILTATQQKLHNLTQREACKTAAL